LRRGADRGQVNRMICTEQAQRITRVDVVVANEYRYLLAHGFTHDFRHELDGPSHGDQRGMQDWLTTIARPWFAAIEELAREDRIDDMLVTFQGFDQHLGGSTPAARLLDRRGNDIQLSSVDDDDTLLVACGAALVAARVNRGLAPKGPYERLFSRF
jgi:hypothetical protein